MTMDWLPRSRRVETLEAEIARLRAQLADAERGLATEAVVAFGERLGAIYTAVTESLAAAAANAQALSEVSARIDALEREHDADEEKLKKELSEWRGQLRGMERQLRLNEKDQADAMRVILDRIAEHRPADASLSIESP